MYFFHVNLLAVLVAALIQFVLGWLWYGVIFAKSWKALVGVKEGAKAENAGGVMALIFIANFILSFAIAQIMILTPSANFSKGTFEGVVCGLGFVIRILPLLAEDWPAEAHVPFRDWIAAARPPRTTDLAWLVQQLPAPPLSPRRRS